MITSKNPVSVSVPREGSARLYVGTRCNTGAGDFVMKKRKLIMHGLSYHPLYGIWNVMKNKCYNKKDKGYYKYGARGIGVYPEWRNDPQAFIDYVTSLPNASVPGLTLDRANNDGNYEPGNLRWVTYHIQAVNKRPKKNRFGYNGIGRQVGGKYYSFININGKHYHLGDYKTIREAVEARDMFIINNELHEYRIQILNKPI